jgi:NADH-quinone oxidoreductase subunit M
MSESRKLVMGEFWKQSVTTLLVLAVVAILVMLSGYSEVLAGFTNFFRNPVNLSIFFPFIGAVVLMFIDHRKLGMLRGWALAFTTIPLIIVLGLWLGWWSWIGQIVNPGSFLGETMRVWGRFVPGVDNFNYFLDRTWIDLLRVHYIVGLDGLSFPMFLLTAFISALACIASFGIKERVKEYFILYLLLVGGMLGVFAALDYFLFYVFWEISLVPMYFLIGIWGGPRRMYAAIKFFLYTLFGSVFMLVGIIIMFLFAGVQSFSMIDLAVSPGLRAMPEGLRLLVFGGFFLAFSIKVPLFPFHTWLPDAHVEAPTPISVILAAILLKMGAYGYMRVMYPSFPDLGYYLGAIIGLLAVISIIYGALVAMVQPDLKKLVAYSSVSHMGFIILGIASMSADGFNGAVMQMVAHGLTTGALFLLVGVIYDRTHTRLIKDLGGLMITMPRFSFIMLVACFGSLGLPGLVGFWGEFLIIKGAFMSNETWKQVVAWGISGDALMRIYAIIAAIGIVLTAAYILWMLERVMLGRENPRWKGLPDMITREYWALVPITVLIGFLGLYPRPVMQLFEYFNASLAQTVLNVFQ